MGAEGTITADLPVKGHERLFLERVPLPRRRVRSSAVDPWGYGVARRGVEAWGFRTMQGNGELMCREEVADAWYHDDYLPVVATLHDHGLIGDGNETDSTCASCPTATG